MVSALILGGARSGKTACALAWARACVEGGEKKHKPVYLATAEARDEEMRTRIRAHRREREGKFETWELLDPCLLVRNLDSCGKRPIVVDCLTMWLCALLERDDGEAALAEQIEALENFLHSGRKQVIFVAAEVGLGIVPDNTLARRFRDHSGRVTQSVAARVESVALMIAGLPMLVKGEKPAGA